jgi:hypothetical protein
MTRRAPRRESPAGKSGSQQASPAVLAARQRPGGDLDGQPAGGERAGCPAGAHRPVTPSRRSMIARNSRNPTGRAPARIAACRRDSVTS